MNRVVITGIGSVCPVGNSFEEAWATLMKGVSGISLCPEVEGLRWTSAGVLKRDVIKQLIPAKDVKRLDRFVLYGHASSAMAVADAGLGKEDLLTAGIVMGSSRGGIGMIEEALGSRVNAYLMAGTTISMAASYPAIQLGIGGHASGVSNACASGASAIGEAFRTIRYGHAAIMLAGGTEAPLTRLCAEGYGRAGALSKKGISRPFDQNRDGFVLAEGSAVLVLEEYGHAARRGARIYAEIAGYGSSCDASHPTEPTSEGQVRAIRSALADAGCSPCDITLVCAHATSTRTGDAVEAASIIEVFGRRGVKVCAPKSMTGHMLGASGAFESAISAMALHTATVPPTINISDCGFDLDCPSTSVPMQRGLVISNSFGFGGVNAVLVFAAAESR